MITAHEWLAGEAGWWWPGVADHLWQATLFGLIVTVACLALKRGPARLRHSLWLLALAKSIVPAGLFLFLAGLIGIDSSWFFQSAIGSQESGSLLQGIAGPVSTMAGSYEFTVVVTAIRHNEIYCVLTVVWLAGFLAFLGVWAMGRRKFMSALKEGRRMDQGREWQALERAKKSLGWKRDVELVVSPHKTEPAVCRVWKPVVLVPQAIADHLDDDELEAIMLHELIHIRRHDNLIGNLQMTICALLWFHPLVWFISSKLFDERELACDEEVLKLRGTPEAYASGILKVVRFSLGWRVAGVTGVGSGSNLRRRIENIMTTNNTNHRATGWHRFLAGTLLGFAFILMVVAGVYTPARNASAAVKEPAVQEGNVGSVVEGNSIDPISQPNGQTRRNKTNAPPPPPPQPAQEAQPAQPAQPAQAANPTQPAQPTQPAPATPQTQPNPSAAPAPPAPPTASTPSMPPPPPPAQTKGKTKPKSKAKRKDDKEKVEKGGLIEAPHPVYPNEAREQSVEGTVEVAIVISEEGNVISAKPTSGPEVFYGAAKDAAFKARFRPTLVNGKPAKVAGALSYNFVIKK